MENKEEKGEAKPEFLLFDEAWVILKSEKTPCLSAEQIRVTLSKEYLEKAKADLFNTLAKAIVEQDSKLTMTEALSIKAIFERGLRGLFDEPILCYASDHGYNHHVLATQVFLSPSGAVRCFCDKHSNKKDQNGFILIKNAVIENGQIRVYPLANVPMAKTT